MTNEERLAAIRELAEKATAGQWYEQHDEKWCVMAEGPEDEEGFTDTEEIAQDYHWHPNGQNNTAFIAAARTEVPWLCEQLGQAQQTIAMLEDALVEDASDLWDVTTAIKKEMEGRSWITEGRGPYEWSDDDYRKEAGWAFEAVLSIIAKVQPPAARRFHEVLRKSKDGPARRLREAEQRAEQAERERDEMKENFEGAHDIANDYMERAEKAAARERALTVERDELREDADIDRLTFGTAEDAVKRAEQAEARERALREAAAAVADELHIDRGMNGSAMDFWSRQLREAIEASEQG
jgi:hypothetical protein